MFTSENPAIEHRRQLLTIIQYNWGRMSDADQSHLACVIERSVFLNRLWPGLGSRYLQWEVRRAWRRAQRSGRGA